jgi:predicted DNA-binding transcriptional regulator AlpA
VPAMTIPPAFGLTDLADRWGLSKTATLNWTKADGFPAPRRINRDRHAVWEQADVIAWEQGRRDDGLPVPGELGNGQRGPDRQPRKRRGAPDDGGLPA